MTIARALFHVCSQAFVIELNSNLQVRNIGGSQGKQMVAISWNLFLFPRIQLNQAAGIPCCVDWGQKEHISQNWHPQKL